MASIMHVQKRNGDLEEVSFDKVLNRIKKLSTNLNINVFEIAQKVCSRIYNGVKTTELDELAAQLCSSMMLEHPDYGVMASRIIVSNHHKNTSPSFSETIQVLYDNEDAQGNKNPLVSKELYEEVQKHREKLNVYLDYSRDYNFDYFGFKTLEKAYLMRVKGKVVERPQHMFMRVALGIHGVDLKDALQTYDMMSRKYFVHATPTLFNAGTQRPQCSSCFLLASDDSISGIYDTLKECAMISKYAGGIGLHIHDIRARNSVIRGTNGTSTGIVPMLRVYNNTARYVNQCFTPDTPVITTQGSKAIIDVKVGDMVLTSDGTYQRVLCTFANKIDREILEITNKYTFKPIRVTKEHKILTYNKNLMDIKYKYADEIDAAVDMVGYKKDNLYGIKEDADYFKFYAMMLVNGKIFSNGKDFCLTCTNKVSVAFATSFLQQHDIPYWLYHNKSRTTSIVRWLKNMGKLFLGEQHIYDQAKKRRFYPNYMFVRDVNATQAFIDGLRMASRQYRDHYFVSLSDENVAMDLKFALIHMGVVAKCSIDTNGKYVICLPEKGVVDKNVVAYGGMLWVPIDNISPVTYKGTVHDLNVEDNHNYTTSMGVVHNSGRRNGSIAIYLEPWHADIEPFLELRKNHGVEEERARDLFYALWIPDLFMKRVKENGVWSLMCPDMCKGLSDTYGDEFEQLYERYEKEGKFIKQVQAQDLWFKILESQIETGTPYMLYKDHVNRKSNQKNLGVIKSSNLCVAPETKILTDKGYFEIASLKDQAVKVWNGKEFSDTVVRKTGVNQKLIIVRFDNGMSLRCTPYHKFYIEEGSRSVVKSRLQVLEAKDLQLGMRIIRYETPTLNLQSDDLKYAYTQGLFAADYTYYPYDDEAKHQWSNTPFCKRHPCGAQSNNDTPMLYLYGEKKKLIEHINWNYYNKNEACDRLDVQVPQDVKHKYFVPINYNIVSKVAWLTGYLDGDGCVVENNGIKNIQVSHVNEIFIKEVFYMLQTLGITPSISTIYEGRNRSLPNGHDACQDYMCKTLYRLNIDSTSILHLIDLGYAPHRLDVSGICSPHHTTNKFVRVSAVVDNNECADTFCFNEPREHKGIFNGILTSQCSEIVEYTSDEETAVCNLASLCLPTYVEEKGFNFEMLHTATKILVKNINKVIDINYYPVEKAKVSNLRHRPIGIGVQGLADTFVLMRMPFDSDMASKLNREIFETIYHAAVEASMELAKKHQKTYSSFHGSPTSEGLLQFDLWNVIPTLDRYDWDKLKEDVKTYGMLNSLLVAPMPTASTSQIMGFNEAFEPFTSNIYKRKTLAGEFILVNKYLIQDLQERGLWNTDMKNKIILNEGSIQQIDGIPQDIKDLYKIVWEIKQKVIIDMAADRGAFVDQSQSMNLFMESPDFKKLSSMHFYAWQKGLKTGMYYLRTKAKAKAQQFTMDPKLSKYTNIKDEMMGTGCESCSA